MATFVNFTDMCKSIKKGNSISSKNKKNCSIIIYRHFVCSLSINVRELLFYVILQTESASTSIHINKVCIMKKVFMLVLSITTFCLLSLDLKSQEFQIPNAGFENWDNEDTKSEPTHWNSFPSADCIMSFGCAMAKTPHHFRVTGGRPNSEGQSYLTIYSTSIMGIVANGNMTLGQIRIGHMSASSSENYNYTNRNNTDHCFPFNKSPDSLYVWVKYHAVDSNSKARITAYIHNNTDFKDPIDIENTSAYTAKACLAFASTGKSPQEASWVLKKIPFVYDGDAESHYLLLTMTNNEIPGGGSAGDSLSIDDIELIYSAWAESIKINNHSLAYFQKDKFEYNRYYQSGTNPAVFPEITVIPEAMDASIKIDTLLGPNQDLDSAQTIITITAEDNITQKIYIINHYIAKDTLSTNANINAIYIDGEELPNFHPDTLSYHYELPANYSGFPTINVDLQDDKASYTLIPPDALPGLVVIEVLAQDGETSLSYNIDFSIHVNITEIHSSDNITLYPNPSTGLVNISYDALQPNIDKVQVVDMYGKIIQTLNNTHVYIDLSDVAKGIYFVRFLSKQHIIKTHKIIKL